MDDRGHETVDRWMIYLERQGKSTLTRAAYLNALTHFANWLQQTYSDKFDPQEVIARDIREWKSYGAPKGMKNGAGDLNRDGRVDIVMSSEEGRGIWWFEATEDPMRGRWIRHGINEDYVGVHTLWLADFNGDGDMDILAAEMHTKGGHRVTIFENIDGGRKWMEHVVATTGSHNAVAFDLNGDKKPDIVGCNFRNTENPLEVWYNDAVMQGKAVSGR